MHQYLFLCDNVLQKCICFFGIINSYSFCESNIPDILTLCETNLDVNSFFPHADRHWDSLPIECFSLTYDLSGSKSRINRNLLTLGSF